MLQLKLTLRIINFILLFLIVNTSIEAQQFEKAVNAPFSRKIVKEDNNFYLLGGASFHKTDLNGNVLWTITIPQGQYYTNYYTDFLILENEIFLLSNYNQGTPFEGDTLQKWGMLLHNYSKEGNLKWFKKIEGAHPMNIINSGNHLFILSSALYTVVIDGDTVNNQNQFYGGGAIFRFDLTGKFYYYESAYLSSYINFFYTSHKDSQNNFYSAGDKLWNLDPNMGYQVIVSKYDSAGVLQWYRTAGGKSQDYATGVTTDTEGNIYICGYTSDYSFPAYFGDITIDTPGRNNFLTKVSPVGEFLWVKTFGGDYGENAWAVWADTLDNIYVTGEFTGRNVYFGDLHIEGEGSPGATVYVVCYDTEGEAQWALITDASNGSAGSYDITGDHKGNLYIAGEFGGSIGFGDHSISGNGGYIARICLDSLICFEEQKETSLTEKKEASGFLNVYPNPNRGHFNLQTNLQNTKKVVVRSQSGAVVYEKDFFLNPAGSNPQQTINAQTFNLQLAPGLYFVELTTDKMRMVRKVVVN